MVQERRSEIVQEFLEEKHSVLVTTNVLARGIDLVSVQQVCFLEGTVMKGSERKNPNSERI